MSSGTSSGKPSRVIPMGSRVRAAAHAYRAAYREEWAEFLHDCFEGPAEVAVYFPVDLSTAQNWWDGATAPQAWAVGWALREPGLRARFLARLEAA